MKARASRPAALFGAPCGRWRRPRGCLCATPSLLCSGTGCVRSRSMAWAACRAHARGWHAHARPCRAASRTQPVAAQPVTAPGSARSLLLRPVDFCLSVGSSVQAGLRPAARRALAACCRAAPSPAPPHRAACCPACSAQLPHRARRPPRRYRPAPAGDSPRGCHGHRAPAAPEGERRQAARPPRLHVLHALCRRRGSAARAAWAGVRIHLHRLPATEASGPRRPCPPNFPPALRCVRPRPPRSCTTAPCSSGQSAAMCRPSRRSTRRRPAPQST